MSRSWHGIERVRTLLAACVACGLAACATQSGTVVLLPEKDGRNTAVTVRQGDRTLLLDRPYAAANLTSDGPQAAVSSADEVDRRFGAALAAQPARPRVFTLYFVEQTDAFTEESRRMLDGVMAEIARHPAPDIVVIGHTDLVGSDSVNDALARKRADTVRAVLAERGVAAENVVAIGRGKREPVVPTPDGVAEPLNRRVEIVVR
jgi:outer membrane protein OmpA-like peptidoglycan-associated protein